MTTTRSLSVITTSDDPMKGVMWPIGVGFFFGVAVAAFAVYRFPDADNLQTAATTRGQG